MRKTIGTLYENIISKSDSKKKLDSEIELVSNETTLEIRGGDNEYTPMYDDIVDKQTKWFFPSMLL